MPVEEIEQKIKTTGLFPIELDLEPDYVRLLTLNNKFQRTLPLLSAWTGSQQVLLRATSGGLLKVSSVPTVFESYERNPTTDTDGYITISGSTTKTETFSQVMYKIDIVCKDNPIYIQISSDGSTWGDKIQLDAGDVFSENISCKAVKLTNVTTDGSANGSYQVVGYI